MKRIRIAEEKPTSVPELPAPVPRITRLMALAIWFDELIRTGEVESYAELAKIGGVSRARVTQIMDLLNLDPTTQTALLNPRSASLPSERCLRAAGNLAWSSSGLSEDG